MILLIINYYVNNNSIFIYCSLTSLKNKFKNNNTIYRKYGRFENKLEYDC